MMENIIYNELRYRGYQVDVGTVESREKDPSGKEIRVQREIDFIASLGSKKYYIQSAYAISDQEKYEQETKSFEHTMDSFKKIIIIEKSMKPRYDEHGYLMMGVKEFLLDANSLLIWSENIHLNFPYILAPRQIRLRKRWDSCHDLDYRKKIMAACYSFAEQHLEHLMLSNIDKITFFVYNNRH